MAYNMNSLIPLTKPQKEIMEEFYHIPPTQVVFNKNKRTALWKAAISRTKEIDFNELEKKCPALSHQIQKSYENGNNIQSAVFSECVYAQTFANMLNLNKFVNCYSVSNFIPENIQKLLESYNLVARYIYSTEDGKRMLIQAGGYNGIDSALITVIDLTIYTIEFKEPGAKTSELDLPKYKENGNLLITHDFITKYPQFNEMLNEQKDLNFFDVMGKNIHNFSKKSIHIAVSNNYTKKYADVICTEDKNGNLVMLPTNQIPLWANIAGEIRPAGRNHYNVWTPNALKKFLTTLGATFSGSTVSVNISKLSTGKERGGGGKISRYKINPLFFIYVKHCTISGEIVSFDMSKITQLNPTIAGKIFFCNLLHNDVYQYYIKFFDLK